MPSLPGVLLDHQQPPVFSTQVPGNDMSGGKRPQRHRALAAWATRVR